MLTTNASIKSHKNRGKQDGKRGTTAGREINEKTMAERGIRHMKGERIGIWHRKWYDQG